MPCSRAVVGASFPIGKKGLRLRAHWVLSSGQTIRVTRPAMRSACCSPEPKLAAQTARPIFLFFFKRNAQMIIFLRRVLKNPLQPGQIFLHLSLASMRQHHYQR